MNAFTDTHDADVAVLVSLFNEVFSRDYNTQLVHAATDPEYIPADNRCSYHQIAFAHGFFSSALHEIAHWCIAGEARRTMPDYGYWYAPDGRNAEQQQAFYQVEIKPQALEWIFSVAAGRDFRVSTDNLEGDVADDLQFEQDVLAQVHAYLNNALAKRPMSWALALAEAFNTGDRFLSIDQYQLPKRAHE